MTDKMYEEWKNEKFDMLNFQGAEDLLVKLFRRSVDKLLEAKKVNKS